MTGQPVLRMMPDYGSAIWRVGGPVDFDWSLPAELDARLEAWATE